MKSLFSVVCMMVLVGMATSCCFPDQGSFDFTIKMNSTATYMGKTFPPHNQSLSGSASFDFAQQKFYLSIPEFKAEAYIELSKNKKSATMVSRYQSEDGPRERCFEAPLDGKIGKPWQCILDNNIFYNSGNGYLLIVPPLYADIKVKNGTCFPTDVYMEYTVINRTHIMTKLNAEVELTNIDEKVVDETVFKAPCKAEERERNTYMIPTPYEVVQMIQNAIEPKSESESEEASPESDESD